MSDDPGFRRETHATVEPTLEQQVAYWKARAKQAEAVIEAARAQVSAEGRVTEEHHRLVDALAALDAAQKDGQTTGGPAENEALINGVVDAPASTTPPPAVCPCDGTDCVC